MNFQNLKCIEAHIQIIRRMNYVLDGMVEMVMIGEFESRAWSEAAKARSDY